MTQLTLDRLYDDGQVFIVPELLGRTLEFVPWGLRFAYRQSRRCSATGARPGALVHEGVVIGYASSASSAGSPPLVAVAEGSTWAWFADKLRVVD